MTRCLWLLALLALALAPPAAAQVRLTLTPAEPATLRGRAPDVYAGQYAELKLSVRNAGQAPITVENILGERIPCPAVKVYDKAGGPPRQSPLTDCIVGKPVRLAGGGKGTYQVQLPLALQPGEYTVILTLPTRQGVQYPRTTLRVGPGPFVAEVRVPPRVRAGTPLPLTVAFHNVWRTTQQEDLRLCSAGLLIRDETGRTVYDKAGEQALCAQILVLHTVRPGAAHVEKWNEKPLPKLPPGRYTAILWGKYNASLRFEVTK